VFDYFGGGDVEFADVTGIVVDVEVEGILGAIDQSYHLRMSE
jgi:hypothetical protein